MLDLMMPNVTGFDVVEALQRNSETASIPILVVTAKRVSALDRAALNTNPDQSVHMDEESEFVRGSFIAEVKRALSRR